MAFYHFSAFLFLLSTLLIQQKLICGESTVESSTTSIFTTTEKSTEAVTNTSITAVTNRTEESTETVTNSSTTVVATRSVPQTSDGGQLNVKFVCSFSYKIYNETVKNGTEEIVRPNILLRPVCCTGYKWNGTNCVPHCEGGCGEGVCKFPGMCICEKKFQYCHFGNYSRPSPREAANVSCLEKCKNGVCLPNNTCQCNKGFRHLDEWTTRYTNSSAECVPFCFPFCSNRLFPTPEECACSYSYQEDVDDSIDFGIDKPKSFKKLKEHFNKYGHPNFGIGANLDTAAGHAVGFGSNSSVRPLVRTNSLNGKPASPGSNNVGSSSSGIESRGSAPLGPRNPLNGKPPSPGSNNVGSSSSGIGSRDSGPFGQETPWSESRGVGKETPWTFNGPLGRAKPLSGSGSPPGTNNFGSNGPAFGSSFRGPVGWVNPSSGSGPAPGTNNFGSSDPASGSSFRGPVGWVNPSSGSGPPPGTNNFGSSDPASGSSFRGPVGWVNPSSGGGPPPGTNNFGSSGPASGSSFRGPVGWVNPSSGSGRPPGSNSFGSGIGLSGSNFPDWKMPSSIGSASNDWLSNMKPIGHKWDIPKISPSFHSSHVGGTRTSIRGSLGGFRGRG